jgi:glycosyltransferase involved in cell wall biosynthesis
MTNLYISPDLGTNSSGGLITENELDALESLGNAVIKIGYDDISPTKYNLLNEPFLIDYLAMNKIASLNGEIQIAHFYSSPFTNTIRYLKARGIKTSVTVDAHDRMESIKEFENLGYTYPFVHIKDDRLWNIYSGYLKEADIVIVPSFASAEFLKKEGVENTRLRIIPHGCDIPDKLQSKTKPEQFNVGYLGAIGPDKGLKYLIQGWSELNYKDSTLILAGRGSEQLGKFINKYATGGKFHLMGWVENKVDFFNNISVYVQPSVTEGFGIEILEALSYGKIVIASEGAGASDCINDRNGFIVSKRDPKAIADKIDLIKNQHIDITEMMETNAILDSKEYSWVKIKQRYIDLWRLLDES